MKKLMTQKMFLSGNAEKCPRCEYVLCDFDDPIFAGDNLYVQGKCDKCGLEISIVYDPVRYEIFDDKSDSIISREEFLRRA
jgi:hypothetical protein